MIYKIRIDVFWRMVELLRGLQKNETAARGHKMPFVDGHRLKIFRYLLQIRLHELMGAINIIF